VWDLASGQAQPLSEHGEPIASSVFLRDGSVGLLREGPFLEVWDPRTGRPLDRVSGFDTAHLDAHLHAVLLRRDGEATLYRGARQQVKLALSSDWQLPGLSPDGRRVLASSLAQGLGIIDVATGKVTALAGAGGPALLPHRFLESGEVVALLDLRNYAVWGPGEREPRRGQVDCDALELNALQGRRLVFYCENALEFLDLASGARRVLPLRQATQAQIALDGSRVTQVAAPDRVWIWDLEAPPPAELRFPQPVDYLTRAEDADRLLVAGGGAEGTLDQLDVARRTASPLAHLDRRLGATAVSREGRQVAWAAAGADEVAWRDLGTGVTRSAPGRGVRALTFSRDGAWLVAATAEGVRLYQTGSGAATALATGGEVDFAELGPEDTWVVAADTGSHRLTLWGLDGQPRRRLETLAEGFTSLSGDGRWLINGHATGEVEVWSTADWSRRSLPGAARSLTTLTVMPDDAHLLLTDRQGTLYLRPLAGGEERVVAQLGRGASSLLVGGEGRRAAAIDGTGSVAVVDLEGGATWRLWDPRGTFDAIERWASPPAWLTVRGAEVRIWPDDLPLEPEALLARLRSLPERVEVRP
jgi:hypothetical protein